MGLYLEKIEENEKKIKKLKATIETSKAKEMESQNSKVYPVKREIYRRLAHAEDI